MKKTKLLASLAILLIVCLLAGCGASSMKYAVADSTAAEYCAEEPQAAPMMEQAVAENIAETEVLTTGTYESGTPTVDSAQQNFVQKIIYSADLRIQTTEFDKAAHALEQSVSAIGGFVENSDVYGNVNYNDDGTTTIVDRSAYYILRIPSASFEAFLQQTEGLGNVLSSSRTAQNVTSKYTDYEARLSALYTQEERLLDMLTKAAEVESLIALEERLADVRYEIESIERNLRNLDMQIGYSTVCIDLQEVEVYTPTAPIRRTFGEKMSDSWRDGWNDFIRGWQNFFIGLVGALPTLAVFAVFVGVGLVIFFRLRKNHKAK
ncbi:MAG: DUF4349 domain-containing protein [Oscillospiraceae bacterium]|nr:DUF4349 domain-containing protein [Oscillospiraceae bacterium]